MSDNNAEVKTIEIIDTPTEQVKEAIDIAVLDPLEQDLAKKLKVVPEEGSEEVKKKEEVKKVEDKKDSPTFEQVEADEKNLLGKFSKNEQGIYFRWKHDKKLRQDAQAERDLTLIQTKTLKTELDKAKADGSLTHTKLTAINDLMTGPEEEITIEAIQAILKAEAKKETPDEDKPLTKKDLIELQKEEQTKAQLAAETNKKFADRMNTLDSFGKDNYTNYDDIITGAKEVFDGKVDLGVIDYKDLARRFVEKVNDPKNSEQEVADFIVGIAKLNPNFGKKTEKKEDKKIVKEGEKKVSSEDIDKIVKNAAKSQTSASAGGNSRRVVNINDISVEDASKLSVDQYKALPKEVKERLRRESV